MDARELESIVRGLVEQRLDKGREGARMEAAPARQLRVVTETDIRDAGLGGTVVAAENAIVTAAAQDLARSWGVKIQRGASAPRQVRRIALGADHGGYEMKEEVKRLLATMDGVEALDLGTNSPQTVDYPDFALAVAETVAKGEAELGILVDGAGIGSAIAANKVPGIRAAMCHDAATARNSREHNFANVLALGGRMIDRDRMREVVTAFLSTATGEERHAGRVRKSMAVEAKYLKK